MKLIFCFFTIMVLCGCKPNILSKLNVDHKQSKTIDDIKYLYSNGFDKVSIYLPITNNVYHNPSIAPEIIVSYDILEQLITNAFCIGVHCGVKIIVENPELLINTNNRLTEVDRLATIEAVKLQQLLRK